MPQTREKTRRNALLAKVHIAKKELAIEDDDYRAILKREFRKHSAKQLTEMELGFLIDYFREKGWTPANGQRTTDNQQQYEILRARAWELAGKIENGDRRMKGLAKKILGVDRLEWCRDVGRLKRLLAVLENIKRETEALWD